MKQKVRSRIDALIDDALYILMFIVICGFTTAVLMGITAEYDATGLSLIEHIIWVAAGMAFGALSCALFKMAWIAKRSGGPGSQHQIGMGIFGGTVFVFLPFVCSVGILIETQRLNLRYAQSVTTQRMIGAGDWIGLAMLAGLIAGNLYALIMIRNE